MTCEIFHEYQQNDNYYDIINNDNIVKKITINQNQSAR